jgi:hypothetical protein
VHPAVRRSAPLALPLVLAACVADVDRPRIVPTDSASQDPATLAIEVPLDRPARAAPSHATPPASIAAGARFEVQGLPVLRLAGSPREMGFQHGRALAAEIKEGFEQFVLKYRCHDMRARYAQIAKRVRGEIAWPAAITAELEGMLEGVQASGFDLSLPALRRDLELVDLEVLNSIDHWGLIGCSGFTAWGRCTKDGEVLCARNFDFDVDPDRKSIARLGLVLAFEPQGGVPFASFAFPGMVGVCSGLSEEGVGIFLHVGNGSFGGGDLGLSLPPTILSRLVIEESAPDEAAARTRELIAEARFRNSFLVRIVTPGGDAPPTTVFEVDPNGFGEQALPDESAGEPPLLVTTNHYLTRPSLFPVIPDSKVRFCNLEESAQACLVDGDRAIDEAEAWAGLRKVEQVGVIATLHSLVFRPATLELWAAFSKVDLERGGLLDPATGREPARIKLVELFGRN